MSSASVERIFREIQYLPNPEKVRLFAWLQEEYKLVLAADNYQDFKKPWDDPRNGFGPLQTRLLQFLDGQEALPEREVIRHLWRQDFNPIPGEYLAEIKEELGHHVDFGLTFGPKYKKLQARLRQLERSVRKRFFTLKYDWTISRPRAGVLQLRIQPSFFRKKL